MKTSDFHYHLPKNLIAQTPCEVRSQSRLLHYSRQHKTIAHQQFSQLNQLIEPGDLLVFNNTKVIPARLFGHKESGGKVEILVERVIQKQQCLAHVKASKTPKIGSKIMLSTHGVDFVLEVIGREDSLFILKVVGAVSLAEILQTVGHMPLPPYITRADTLFDKSRYQTVYAKKAGAVAAPTAGLHFDTTLLTALKAKGVNFTEVTLHIGAGTFQPVRSDTIEQHKMHHEYLEVSAQTVQLCEQTRAQGKRIIAVGTTAVRCLETASASGKLQVFQGDTNIFIYPGYQFKSIDALITNFHLPESTLIMLVSALAGKDEVMRCYAEAVLAQYRFFSYGDAMFIS